MSIFLHDFWISQRGFHLQDNEGNQGQVITEDQLKDKDDYGLLRALDKGKNERKERHLYSLPAM